MLLAGAVGGNSWVAGQVRPADSLAELAVERTRVQRNDDRPVAGLIGTIGHDGVVARAHRLRIVPGKEIQFGEVPQEPHHAVVQPDIDDLPTARALPLLECCKNPERSKQATGEVAHQTPLVAIDREEIVTLTTTIGWDDARLIPDAWGLDLENLGPEVSQQHGTVGAGQHACQIENTDTLERTSIGRRCHKRVPWDDAARLDNSTVAGPKAGRSPRWFSAPSSPC